MPNCKIVSFLVPDGPPYFANGSVRAVSRCETHGWSFEGCPSTPSVGVGVVEGLCPIGRIEQATEQAIAEIRKAVQSATGADHVQT